MDDLIAARAQMGMSLAFHIVFAAIGIGLPLLMVTAEFLWLKTGESVYLTLAKRWAKGAAILFAVGAVSGTVLSFELGLLWPYFMRFAGSIIGMPFSYEGFAFFTEAIFLGIYLYGWKKVAPWAHLLCGLIVVISGAASAVFVITANAWMNTPTGFTYSHGVFSNIDPVKAMFNPNALAQNIHMLIAAYAATGFALAGIHALAFMKDRQNIFHQRALTIGLALASVMALVEPFSGDFLARTIAVNQPLKLAAMEGLFKTEKMAPLHIGGLPDEQTRTTPYSIEILGGLSVLAFHNFNATVKGMNDFPRNEWPNTLAVHIAFQIMLGCATIMALVGAWFWLIVISKQAPIYPNLFLKAVLLASPLGFIAIESGWMVTELGRQPWIIYGVMRTKAAVTPMPGIIIPCITFTLLYLFLALVVVWLIRRQVLDSPYVVAKQD